MIAAQLAHDAGYEAWREKARALLAQRIAPEQVAWGAQGIADLFGQAFVGDLAPASISVPRAFVEVAEKAALHNDPERFALLYRVLWRLQRERGLMEDAADPDVFKLLMLAKAVRRDEHKMHAFVRFREIADADGPRFVAWYEPQHHIIESATPFFVRRFAGMRWSVVTPGGSAHWDGETLRFGPGGKRGDVPPEDAREADWRVYYEHMFNPARLKVAAMKREMPKRVWKNLPEASLIPDLVRKAGARADEMVAAEATTPAKRAGAAVARIRPKDLPDALQQVAAHRSRPRSMPDLRAALSGCRACPLWKDATQAVPGEGRLRAPLLALVGEQPGDQEDLEGQPFVGPAGQVLNRALEEAGIVRSEIYVTNAVKHFKHEPRGKRRLHKRPNAGEIDVCRWWMESELALVRPKLIVALGATALYALSGHKGALGEVRGKAIATREGAAMRATIHPCYLLRIRDGDAREREHARFIADLAAAKRWAERIAP